MAEADIWVFGEDLTFYEDEADPKEFPGKQETVF